MRKLKNKLTALSLVVATVAASTLPQVAAADDATLQQLDAVRQQQATYEQQRGDLQKQADNSAEGLKDAQAALAKQQSEVDGQAAKLQSVTDKITKLKKQRAAAMQASYQNETGTSYLYALATSASLSEFLRKGEYTDILLKKKTQIIDEVDKTLDGLEKQRDDLLTAKNAAESALLRLQKRINEIQAALTQNKADSDAAKALEGYLAGLIGDYTQGGCHRVGGDQASGTFTLAGSGTEHGLGMSQYGAKGAAQHGKSYRDIISHYYQNTSVGNVGSFQTNQGESETYLVGVVEAEMNSNWPMEALKAQAIAARSYAYMNRSSLDNSPATQAWVGPSQQTENARRAVRETAGQVVMYGGQVVQAFFHSTSGGCTENNENVWGGTPLPWLRGVSSPYESDSPHWNWNTRTYSREQMEAIVNADSRTSVGTLQTIKIVGRGVSGRVTSVQVVGSAGTKSVSGPAFKRIFNNNSPGSDYLESTLFGFK